MISPFVRLIVWTTAKVFTTVMRIFPKPKKYVHNRYIKADSDFLRTALLADKLSYDIADTFAASYIHAPLCPLPAEISYLLPLFAFRCLETVYLQVRLMSAGGQGIGRSHSVVPPPFRYVPMNADLDDEDNSELAEYCGSNVELLGDSIIKCLMTFDKP